MPLFPSEEWLLTYVDRVNSSQAYEAAAATWEGDVTFVFEAEGDKGVPEDIYAWMDLWHGKCRRARYGVGADEGQKARFLVRGPYSRWKEIVRKELDPIKAILQGKLKLKGDLPVIVRYMDAANELVNLAGEVPTTFVDES
ncbi:MAG: SCP2 sterol-binding domain-containing protein [Acidimicrobiales bacterium]